MELELPEVGQTMEQGEIIGVVQSLNDLMFIQAPFSGKVTCINEEVVKNPRIMDQYTSAVLPDDESKQSFVRNLVPVGFLSDYYGFFTVTNLMRGQWELNVRYRPGRGGQTEVTPDQTSFERTHVPGAVELHGLEKASSAL